MHKSRPERWQLSAAWITKWLPRMKPARSYGHERVNRQSGTGRIGEPETGRIGDRRSPLFRFPGSPIPRFLFLRLADSPILRFSDSCPLTLRAKRFPERKEGQTMKLTGQVAIVTGGG